MSSGELKREWMLDQPAVTRKIMSIIAKIPSIESMFSEHICDTFEVDSWLDIFFARSQVLLTHHYLPRSIYLELLI